MAYKDKEKSKEYNKQWYLRTRKNNPKFKEWKKQYDKEFHENYINPNLTPEKSQEYSRKHRKNNLEKIRKRDREYKKRNYSDKQREQNRLWRENNKDRVLEQRRRAKESGSLYWSQIKSRYGITKQEYFLILERQFNLCPICNQVFDGRKKCVDHCHKTDKVRGIIHRECNLVLGFAEDKIKNLENAIKYLNKNYEPTISESGEKRAGEGFYEI